MNHHFNKFCLEKRQIFLSHYQSASLIVSTRRENIGQKPLCLLIILVLCRNQLIPFFINQEGTGNPKFSCLKNRFLTFHTDVSIVVRNFNSDSKRSIKFRKGLALYAFLRMQIYHRFHVIHWILFTGYQVYLSMLSQK